MRLAHISLYPPKGAKHVNGSGVISYTKNLVTHIGGEVEQHMLCNRTDGQSETYQEDGIQVHRCFDRGLACLWQLHKALRSVKPDVIHLQQELALFGGIATAYLLQFLVLAWRGRMVLTLHHAVDTRTIDRAFVRQNNSRAPVWLVRLAFRLIYVPLTRWSRHIIVHEMKFKHILVDNYGVPPDKIAVIPHGVEDTRTIDTAAARRALKLKPSAHVVLFMGYATGYKGIDLLIEGFAEYAQHDPKAYLLLGAGVHPKLKDNKTYQAKYRRLQETAAALIPAGQYRWVGFIDEPDIVNYYSAANVSVYPYTVTLSSSGPMSIAIGYEKPFLASAVFSDVFADHPDLLFKRTPEALADKLAHFFAHPAPYQNLSAQLKTQRTWASVGEKTTQVYQAITPITKEGDYAEESIAAG